MKKKRDDDLYAELTKLNATEAIEEETRLRRDMKTRTMAYRQELNDQLNDKQRNRRSYKEEDKI